MSATGATVLIKLDSLQSLENYIKLVCYSNYPVTLYFQVQFLKLKCTENRKSTIKSALKSEWKKKYHHWKKYQGPENKMQWAKDRYYRNPESRRQYQKTKYQKSPEQEKNIYKKEISGKSWDKKKNMKKRNIRKIPN